MKDKVMKIVRLTILAILAILQIVFIILKVCSVISWSWLWVFVPIWGYLALLVFIAFMYLITKLVIYKVSYDD